MQRDRNSNKDCCYDRREPFVTKCCDGIENTNEVRKHVGLLGATLHYGTAAIGPKLGGDGVAGIEHEVQVAPNLRSVVGRAELVDLFDGVLGEFARALEIQG
jgi:hypothetical protein